MADKFISLERFQVESAIRKENDKVLKWTELEKGKIYRVQEIEVVYTSRFDKKCFIALFIDQSNETVKVWIGQFLTQKLANKNPNQIPFIASLGQEKNGKSISNLFDLCYTEGEDIYPIFKNESEFST